MPRKKKVVTEAPKQEAKKPDLQTVKEAPIETVPDASAAPEPEAKPTAAPSKKEAAKPKSQFSELALELSQEFGAQIVGEEDGSLTLRRGERLVCALINEGRNKAIASFKGMGL